MKKIVLDEWPRTLGNNCPAFKYPINFPVGKINVSIDCLMGSLIVDFRPMENSPYMSVLELRAMPNVDLGNISYKTVSFQRVSVEVEE